MAEGQALLISEEEKALLEKRALFKKFGFPLENEDFKPSELYQDRSRYTNERSEHMPSAFEAFSLNLRDRQARDMYIELMSTYPDLFKDGNAQCSACKGEIVLPIDLRRDAGTNYHGDCFDKHLLKEITGPIIPEHGVLEYLKEVDGLLKRQRICELAVEKLPKNPKNIPKYLKSVEGMLRISRSCIPHYDEHPHALARSLDSTPIFLEHKLQAARVCRPHHSRPLALEDLEGLEDREKLNGFYFSDIQPFD